MVRRATDASLGRKTRDSLVFSLVVECLHAFREKREPAIAYAEVQQMIRKLDEEVRIYAVRAVERFVRQISKPQTGGTDSPSAEELFCSAVAPFLQSVWPQERSLATSGVSQVLARLAATTGHEFANAVKSIEPFPCTVQLLGHQCTRTLWHEEVLDD